MPELQVESQNLREPECNVSARARWASPSPRRSARKPGFGAALSLHLVLMSAVVLLGCREAVSSIPLASPSLSEYSPVRPNPSLPWSSFDRRVASVLTGAGWSRTEEDPTAAGIDRFVTTALGDESVLYYAAPSLPNHELYLRCRPLPQESGASIIGATLRINDGPLLQREVGAGWNDLRFQVSDHHLAGSLIAATLAFQTSGSLESNTGRSRPARQRRAICSAVAILPTSAGAPLATLASLHGEDLDEPGASPRAANNAVREIGVPLPPHSRNEVELLVAGGGGSCKATSSVVGTARHAQTVRARLDQSRLIFDAANDSPNPAELRVDVGLATGSGCGFDLTAPALGRIRTAPLADRNRSQPAHVFVYLVDTLRADAILGTFRGLATTPSIRRFAADSVIFGNAWAPSSWTLPSVISMMTGTHPSNHGVWKLDQELPAAGPRTVAETFRSAGYDTVAISQSWIAGPTYGIDRGFGEFFVSEHINGPELRTSDLLTLFRHWAIGSWTGARPIFGYLHTVEPHAPYAPRREDFERFGRVQPEPRVAAPLYIKTLVDLRAGITPRELDFAKHLYQSEVTFADRAFGQFLDLLRHLGLYDEAMILLLSDHGEEFGEHGGYGHGRNLFAEVTRVPLIIKFPHGRWRGRTVERAVSLTDVAPTLIEYLGLESAAGDFKDGLSFLPDLRSERPLRTAKLAEVVTHREGPEEQSRLHRSLLLEGVRCVHIQPFVKSKETPEATRWHFFRTLQDHSEEVVLEADSQGARVCRASLERFERRLAVSEDRSSRIELLDDQIESLRALGYL